MRPCFVLLLLAAPLMMPAAASAPAPQHRCIGTGETAARPLSLSGKRSPTLNRDVRVNDDLMRFSRAF